MKVKATSTGHDGIALRKAGDVFSMPNGSVGSWFESAEVEADVIAAIDGESVQVVADGDQPKRRGRPPKSG